MARPFKTGLDYFPVDTNNDNKLEILESKYGLLGFGFIMKMFQKIYDNGYYLEWNEYSPILLKKDLGLEEETIEEIINFCAQINLFDKELYNNEKILTSRGIQKRYFSISKRRKELQEIINEKYILINLSDYGINVNNNPVSTDINADNNSNSKKDEKSPNFDKNEKNAITPLERG